MVVNVILSGGSGTRLWPLSRESRPKQFLHLFDKQSLFQHTICRNKTIAGDFFIVTNATQIALAQQQAKDVKVNLQQKIIEPIGRNTAPAIALAAMSLQPDDVMIVTPSDHMIANLDRYQSAMSRAVELADDGYLVTFGIKPLSPHTGFGYIEYDGEKVVSFREKPDKKTAEVFLEKGNFSWNSGMFCFKASVFLDELKFYQKEMYEAVEQAVKTIKNGLVDLEAMKAIPADSIDYAILEKSQKIKTVASDFYWTDLGTFDAIIDYFETNHQVNDLQTLDHTSYAFSKKKVFSEVDNVVVVDTEDAILILERHHTDAVKNTYNTHVKTDFNLK